MSSRAARTPAPVTMSPFGGLVGGPPAALLAARLSVAAEAGDNTEVRRLLAESGSDAELAASALGLLAFSVADLARQLSAARAALRVHGR